MRVDATCANPFALMMAPQQVLEAMENSDTLRRLRHQVFHPLDRRAVRKGSVELAAFDAAIERITLVLPPEPDEAQAIS